MIALLAWVMYVLGLSLALVWAVAWASGETIGDAVRKVVRMGMDIKTVVPALWYGLVAIFEIALGCYALGLFAFSSGGLAVALVGLVLIGIGLVTGTVWGLQPAMGVFNRPKPVVKPLYDEWDAVEASEEEIRRKGVIR